MQRPCIRAAVSTFLLIAGLIIIPYVVGVAAQVPLSHIQWIQDHLGELLEAPSWVLGLVIIMAGAIVGWFVGMIYILFYEYEDYPQQNV